MAMARDDRLPSRRMHHRRRPSARAPASAMVVAALVPALAGCGSGPDPLAEAGLLAQDLTDGVVDGATVSTGSETDELLAGLLAGMAEVPRTVEAGDVVREDGNLRTVELTWAWDLGDGVEPWVVPTTAELALVDGAWVTQWSTSLVHPDAAPTSSLHMTRTAPARGDVVGADGSAVVTDRPVFRIGVDKANVPQGTESSAVGLDLARRLGFDDPEGYADRVANAGPAAYVVAITVRRDEAGQWDVAALREVPGVLVRADEIPLAPTSAFARPILGTVGEATAEIVEESDGAVVAGDQVGLSGLQRAYDEVLRGAPGVRVTMTTGDVQEELFAVAPVDGEDLAVTLDTRLQMLAEDVLADVTPASAVVAVRPSTGHVVAAASGAGGGGLSTATVGLFPPGSTFKVATALALLRQGLTADSPVECSPTITVDGREFDNYPGYPEGSLGSIPLREALAQSCNTAMIAQHEVVTAEDVAWAAAALGIGVTGIWSFPYASGSVPSDADGTAHAAGLIGQGGVLASPLAMAVVAASVAQGSSVTPVLVPGEATEVEPPAVPLTADEATSLRTMMREVVTSGTGTSLQDVPGDPVVAKSGTAQFGTADPPDTHAWMIAAQGDLAVAVLVAEGDSGSATAGPLLEEFLRGAAG